MTKYVRYDPERLRYVKIDVPRRQRIGDLVVGTIGTVFAVLLIGGFAIGVLIAVAARVFHFFG